MIPSTMLGHLRCRRLRVLTGPFVCFFLRMFNLTPSYHTMHAPCCPRPHPSLAIVEQVSSKRTYRCRSSFRGLTYCIVQYSSTVYSNMPRCHMRGDSYPPVWSILASCELMILVPVMVMQASISMRREERGSEEVKNRMEREEQTKKPGLW